jgi:mono/diheme cytochrome c family protein
MVLACVAALVGCRADVGPPTPAAGATSRSGPIALALDGRTLWVVNPDADSVTRVDTVRGRADPPLPVGREPWSVAVGPDGRVVVANRGSGDLTVWRGGVRSDLPVGAEPAGLALSPSGRTAYVALSAEGRVVKVDLDGGAIVASAALGPAPEALVVVGPEGAADHEVRLAVTHLRARPLVPGGAALDAGQEGWLTLLDADLAPLGEVAIAPYDFGFPNLLAGVAGHGERLWVAHALNSPELPAGFSQTVSAALSEVGWTPGAAAMGARIHLNESTFSTPVNAPRAVALTADGATAYVVLAGSDQLMGIDVADPAAPVLLGFWPTGANPRGVALSPDGRTAYVMNHLSRDVSVLDLSDPRNRRAGPRWAVVAETLSPTLALGKRLFHAAADPRLSTLGWISCASCHVEGGADGTTWRTPEGARQTMPLWALSRTGPPFHASATRDEVQDFHEDIERLMRGSGLLVGVAHRLLGEPNAGRSAELDALAEFVLHGFRVPAAATPEPAAARGRDVFAAAGCADCHGGPGWTRNALPGPPGGLAPGGELEVTAALVDVGTFRPESGPLGANGFKVPTLLGLHASAPYLHDGSAADLRAVLSHVSHAGPLDPADVDALVAFLRTIDDRTPMFD